MYICVWTDFLTVRSVFLWRNLPAIVTVHGAGLWFLFSLWLISVCETQIIAAEKFLDFKTTQLHVSPFIVLVVGENGW